MLSREEEGEGKDVGIILQLSEYKFRLGLLSSPVALLQALCLPIQRLKFDPWLEN